MKLFNKSSYWIRSVFFTLLQRFSLFFFGLAGFFLLAHYALDKEQIGVYALFQTIITMIEYVKMGLLRNALVKFVHDKRFTGKGKEVQSASLLINILFSLLAVIFLFAGSSRISHLLKTEQLGHLLKWSVLLIVFQIPFNHCEIVQQSNMQFKLTFYAYFLRQGSVFAFILGSILIQKHPLTLEGLVFAQVAAIILACVYFVAASRDQLIKNFYYNKEIVIKLLQYGKYVFGTAAVSHVYKFADHFVTAYTIGNPVMGKIYVSYYSVAGRILGALDVPFMAAADVLFGKNAQAMAIEGPGKVKYYFERMVGTLTALVIPVSLFIFFIPGIVINIIAGAGYLQAIPVLQVMMFFAFLRPFFNQFGYTMDSIGKPHINFWTNVVFLVFSLIVTYAGIRIFGGLMGAVYATTFTILTGCVAFYIILRKTLQIELQSIFKYTIFTYAEIFKLLKNSLSRPV